MQLNKQLMPLLLGAALVLPGVTQLQAAAAVDGNRLINADQEPGSWLAHGRDYTEQRFSPLTQINKQTVADLGLSWSYGFDSTRGLESTPLVIDGMLYVTGSWNVVYAFDAVTGELKWQFDPQVDRGVVGPKLCCDAVNRGVAAWQGKLYTGTLDGRLIALDAETGQQLWSSQTTDNDQAYSITGAPRIVKGKVMIGNGGAEFGVRGYFSAYDADSGEMLWRFYTVPDDPAKETNPTLIEASKTWSGEWWTLGGGGTAWDSMAYDPELDLLYVGIGNGSPWNREIRSNGEGDNLFLSSIVAVRPDTGEYVWHYQTTPGEEWDYTATQHMILADLEVKGKLRKVLMQAPKNGFFYVLDRVTGEFISAENYVAVNWADGVDPATGRPNIKPEARYSTAGKPFLAQPSPFGGHNWQPMSFNPDTGLVYLPTREMAFPYIPDDDYQVKSLTVNLGVSLLAATMPEDPAVRKAIKAATKGRLVAWDPVAQQEAWGIDMPVPWNGGTLSTAGGLVFQGNGKGNLVAYDAANGKSLWSYHSQTGMVAPPISYRVNGEQYVAIMAGWGGAVPLVVGPLVSEALTTNTNRLLVFKLGGKATLPELKVTAKALNPPSANASAETVAEGKAIYHTYCSSCHGDGAVSGGVLPDLRYASQHTFDYWEAIVVNGLKKANGMAAFGSVMSVAQADAVKAYVIKRANDELTAQQATP
ncbi:PQQ-dependent dehydrogenase, methanol/ethanol family [Amphritea sp.]|uniref:PQQ-dependent dehydrogenase, methanol/ethanol family n=1 Tax=Amphritea sp. TaxID=1872502 RepID=UPI003A8FC1A6